MVHGVPSLKLEILKDFAAYGIETEVPCFIIFFISFICGCQMNVNVVIALYY